MAEDVSTPSDYDPKRTQAEAWMRLPPVLRAAFYLYAAIVVLLCSATHAAFNNVFMAEWNWAKGVVQFVCLMGLMFSISVGVRAVGTLASKAGIWGLIGLIGLFVGGLFLGDAAIPFDPEYAIFQMKNK